MANLKVSSGDGYGRSDRKTFTIPSGATGSGVFRVDFDRPYAYFVIRIEDCGGFATNTTLSAQVANDDSPAQTMCDLYENNDPSTLWSKSVPVTDGSTCQFLLTHAFGSRYIKFIASLNTTADVNIYVYGYDPAVSIGASNGV